MYESRGQQGLLASEPMAGREPPVITQPIRVAVLGNSLGVLVAGRGGVKGPLLNYPAALARTERHGRRFEVTNLCRVAGVITEVSGAWLNPLATLRPDVVVLQFGGYDAIPRFIPRRLIAYLMGINRHPGRLRNVYWHRAARLLAWMSSNERHLDRLLPVEYGGYVSTRRFEAELRLLCQRMHRQLGCRILLLDSYDASRRSPAKSARLSYRIARNNAAIRRVANEMSLDVLSMAELVPPDLAERVLGDGLHMDAPTHRKVAEALADLLTRPRPGS